MSELNKGGYPVKNANYWRRQADRILSKLLQTEEDRDEAEAACAELMELNKNLRAEVERLHEDYDTACEEAMQGVRDERRATALRCAEIADGYHWIETDEGGGVIADAIRSEFGL